MFTAKLIIVNKGGHFLFLLTEAGTTPAFNEMPSLKTSLMVP